MKRLVLALAAVLLLLATSSCDTSTTTPSPSPSPSPAPSQTEKTQPPEIYIGGIQEGDVEINENTTFEDIIRSKPTKEGYAFAGWYSDESFTDYINPQSISGSQYAKGTAYAKWIRTEPCTYYVRESTATITDSGRANQQMDIVELNYGELYSLTDLERAGYTSIRVNVSMNVTEVDDGYQYVFLYRDTNCPQSDKSLLDIFNQYVIGDTVAEDPSLLHMHRHEHGPGKKDTSWGSMNFSITLKLNSLEDNLYLRYGASGEKDDTWRNSDVQVTITPVR